MTAQIVQQPAVEREKPAMNASSTAPAAGSAKAPQTEAPAHSKRPRVIVAGALLVAGLAGFGLWDFFFAGPSVEPGVISVSGRIEGDDSAVAAKTSGRIREITVREGDHIEDGRVIATSTISRSAPASSRPRPPCGRPRLASSSHATRSPC